MNIRLSQKLSKHLIIVSPFFLTIVNNIIAWKWELTGGIIFIILGLLLGSFLYTHNYSMNQSVWLSLSIVFMMGFPYVLAGILFLLSHKYGKKSSEA